MADCFDPVILLVILSSCSVYKLSLICLLMVFSDVNEHVDIYLFFPCYVVEFYCLEELIVFSVTPGGSCCFHHFKVRKRCGGSKILVIQILYYSQFPNKLTSYLL